MRFEDLCLNLVYPYRDWEDIRHYGRSGKDGGVDIFALEKQNDDTITNWFVQCRRYAKATKATLIKSVDDALSHADTPLDVLLVVISCDVSRESQEAFEKYALERSVKHPYLWTQSILEAKLYSDRPDLLFTYFGIDQSTYFQNKKDALKHKLELKKKMRNDFFKKEISHCIPFQPPWTRLIFSEAIFHWIEDNKYPDFADTTSGVSNWFKAELYNFYHNGIEILVHVYPGIVDSSGRWAIIKYDQEFDQSTYKRINVIQVGKIPFSNIVDYDLSGDEFYNIPHIYCIYSSQNGPYEGNKYVLDSDRHHWELDDDMRFTYNG